MVFIDETWASTKMARTHGRGPRGKRLRSPIPHGHWKTTTFVAALRTSGMVAPMVLDGPINGDAFQAYVDQVLVPELKSGEIVVMDSQHQNTRSVIVNGASGWTSPLLTRQLPRDEQQHPAAVAIDMPPDTEQFLTPARQDRHSRRL